METKQYEVERINPPTINDTGAVIEVIFNRPITHNEALEWWNKVNAMPALLEACKHFFEWHANHFEDFDDEVNGQLLCLANEAEAAIALAEPAEKGE